MWHNCSHEIGKMMMKNRNNIDFLKVRWIKFLFSLLNKFQLCIGGKYIQVMLFFRYIFVTLVCLGCALAMYNFIWLRVFPSLYVLSPIYAVGENRFSNFFWLTLPCTVRCLYLFHFFLCNLCWNVLCLSWRRTLIRNFIHVIVQLALSDVIIIESSILSLIRTNVL